MEINLAQSPDMARIGFPVRSKNTKTYANSVPRTAGQYIGGDMVSGVLPSTVCNGRHKNLDELMLSDMFLIIFQGQNKIYILKYFCSTLHYYLNIVTAYFANCGGSRSRKSRETDHGFTLPRL